MSSSSSDSGIPTQAARIATSARTDSHGHSAASNGGLFAQMGEVSTPQSASGGRDASLLRPAWLRSRTGSDQDRPLSSDAGSSAAGAAAVFTRAERLQSQSSTHHDASSVASRGSGGSGAGAAAAGESVAQLDLNKVHGDPQETADADRNGSNNACNAIGAHGASDDSLQYTSESSGRQDSQRTEVAVVQPNAVQLAGSDVDRVSTGASSSLLPTSLPSGFMVTMDGSQRDLRAHHEGSDSDGSWTPPSSPRRGVPADGQAATSGCGHVGGVGEAEDPFNGSPGAPEAEDGPPVPAQASHPSREGRDIHKPSAAAAVPQPSPGVVHDPVERSKQHGSRTAGMKNAFGGGGMHSRAGGESTVRFADEEDSQPSSKGTTALLKDSSETDRNPSYMTNCRMQMLIMEEPPAGARSADYVCYLRSSMDAMRSELHAVMEQTHKAQTWMKRRERLLQLQQGLLPPTTSEMFVFSAPWSRLRARFEGQSRSVAWSELPNRYHFLRAKGADVALLEEAANELLKVIWRRASVRSHADIEVSMVLQPTQKTAVGSVVAPSVQGVINASRVAVPSSVSASCFGCFAISPESGAAGRSATYAIQHSDEEMMDDTYANLGTHASELHVGQWFRFVLVVRFADKGPSATSRSSRATTASAMPAAGSGQESDNPIESMQRQLAGNSIDAFPLNDDEYVGVQIAREVARLHGGHVTFEYLPGSARGVAASGPGSSRQDTGIVQAVFSVFAQCCNPLESMANDVFSLGSAVEASTATAPRAHATSGADRNPLAMQDVEAAAGCGESKRAPTSTLPSDAVRRLAGQGRVEAAAAAAQSPNQHSPGSGEGLATGRLQAMFREQLAGAMHPSVPVIEGPLQALHPSVQPEDHEAGTFARPGRVHIYPHAVNNAADDPTADAAAAKAEAEAAAAVLYGGSSPNAGVHTPPAAAGYQLSLSQRRPSMEVQTGSEGELRPPEELLDITTADLATKARTLDALSAKGVVLLRKFHPVDCRHHVLVVTPRKTTAESLAHILSTLPIVCSYAVASTTDELEQMVLAPCSKGIPLPTAVFVTSQLGQAYADVLAYFLRRNGLLGVTIAVAMPGEEEKLLQLFPQVMRSPCLASDVNASLLQTRYE